MPTSDILCGQAWLGAHVDECLKCNVAKLWEFLMMEKPKLKILVNCKIYKSRSVFPENESDGSSTKPSDKHTHILANDTTI